MITVDLNGDSVFMSDELLVTGQGNTIEDALKNFCKNLANEFMNEKDKTRKQLLYSKIISAVYNGYLTTFVEEMDGNNTMQDTF